MSRIVPHVVVSRTSPFQSSRNGVRPSLIVVHATESSQAPGSGDLAAIASWFSNPAAQVSAHVCTDADGHSARFVADERKAWHCAGYNSVALGIEQIGHAADARWDADEYRETARWIARWSLRWVIPIRKGAVSDGHVLRSGVCRHSDLGAIGGGHYDPGPHYDLRHCLGLARFYRAKLLEAHRRR
jgi:N-acetyl-anhydromuramyl-L-alanine amidase AmpD